MGECKVEYFCVGLVGLTWLLAIAASSIMLNQGISESWRDSILRYWQSSNQVNVLLKSWSLAPFNDIVAIKSGEEEEGGRAGCPETHPENVIFDVWPGIKYMC